MIKHHINEEEKRGGMFSEARDSDMDLVALGEQLATRKAQLEKTGGEEDEGADAQASSEGGDEDEDEDEDEDMSATRKDEKDHPRHAGH
jgi:hypothetical protein